MTLALYIVVFTIALSGILSWIHLDNGKVEMIDVVFGLLLASTWPCTAPMALLVGLGYLAIPALTWPGRLLERRRRRP
jgi:hypothetical protein